MDIFNIPFLKVASAKTSLARSLLRVTLTLYLSLAFLLTLGQLILEYKNEKARLSSEIENVILTFNPIISKALWNVDEEQTLASLQGMLNINHDIKHIELLDGNNKVLYKKSQENHKKEYIPNDSILSRFIFEEYSYRHKIAYSNEYIEEQIIGNLVVKSNSIVVFNRAAHTFFITIISAIFKTLLLCIIFYLIINQIIGKPLKRITQIIRNFKAQDKKIFTDNEDLLARDDELGVMVKTFHAMTHSLIIKDRDLHAYSQSLEQKVKSRTYQLEKASQAKSEFLAAMSHEIRTPMNGILGLINLLGETPLSQDQRQYIEIIEKSGESLIHIINEILDNLKIESNAIEIENVEFDLESTLNESIALFLEKSRTLNIETLVIYSPTCPKTVIGDPTRVRQIVINLLGNAFKFTQKGSIILQAQCDDTEQDHITISISDTGIGIKEALFEQLFLPYGQADSATTRLYGGTGLGLCICKKLAELMGGSIGVNSEIHKGSTFWFKIPLPCENHTAVQVLPEDATPLESDIFLFFENSKYENHIEKLLLQNNLTTKVIENYDNLMERIENNAGSSLFIIGHSNDKLSQLLVTLNHSSSNSHFKILLVNAVPSILNNLHNLKNYVTVLPLPFSNSTLIETIKSISNGTPENPPKNKVTHAYPNLSALSVIVAEDNPVNQIVITGYLKKFHISATVVETGQQVISACASRPNTFDLILMDGEMPEMDGWEATKQIRALDVKRPNNLPIIIIALSAHAMEDYKVIAKEVGMDGFLNKPLDKEQLEKVLLNAFNSL